MFMMGTGKISIIAHLDVFRVNRKQRIQITGPLYNNPYLTL